PAIRRPLALATSALISVWALAGFYGSVGPALVRTITGSNSLLLGGLALFTLAGSGVVAVLVLRNVAPRAVMTLGTAALIVGVGLTLVAISTSSAATFFVGV